MNPGTIVRCRNREWVLLPSDQEEVYLLRPLTGAVDEAVAIHKQLTNLIGFELPEERVRSATFPLPTEADLADAASAHLLWQSARLTLREGATPFRSLGRISIRPRVYQFVPLLMALRLDPVRLLIADDVGVGKTIEALLIAREMYDRGEIRRIGVLCPPYLCDQWQQELALKFNMDAVVIRSGTVGPLERSKAGAASIYRHYPIFVASIDFLKSERNKQLFLMDCPDLVIVDEAHGAAAADTNQNQQLRHRLLRDIARQDHRHLILVTATPHSGIESAFQSLAGLLRPAFGDWSMADLNDTQRTEVAKHFVQRTRKDIEHDWEGEHCFPRRESVDLTYHLSKAYWDLFSRTYDFCSEMVFSGETLDKRQRRIRHWGALALLRCVMSSPAAARATMVSREPVLRELEDEPDFAPLVFESSDEQTDDATPTPAIESAESTLAEPEQRRLRELARLAQKLEDSPEDTKLAGCAQVIGELLNKGGHPIVWCRYIATAEYVAAGLQKRLDKKFPNLRVMAITGLLGDDERRTKIKELGFEALRVLVATDCLSEGINLQEWFDAVLHYDLPWNPNRLEQREGRVDRYGQRTEVVRAIRYFGDNNPMDGVLLEVLLDKARTIHRALGTHVPVPEESESVTQAVLNALFLRCRKISPHQPLLQHLESADPTVETFHRRWERDAERERINRTKFAQRALKPGEVRQELEATDAVLGDPAAVREFVLAAAQRIGLPVTRDRRADVFRVAVGAEALATLPEAIAFVLPQSKSGTWAVTFISPAPEGAEYLGRNHPFVATLARFLMEEALTAGADARATRCGVIRTKAVTRLTAIHLLRVRYLIQQPKQAPLLAEEVIVTGHRPDAAGAGEWLPPDDALRLLAEAQADANIAPAEKRDLVRTHLQRWPHVQPVVDKQIAARAAELEKAHKRIRQAVSLRVRELKVEPQQPADLLGVLILQPVVSA